MKALAKDSGIWQWALFSFVLAGLAGFLFRLGFIYPLPPELSLDNIRHAHSHLMFFGWAALLPLYLIKLDTIPGYHVAFGARLMKASLWVSILFGLLSFPAFLLWGYNPVAIGSASIPISAIISGLVMIGWYGFMAGYLITRYFKHNYTPNVWFEGAMVMLFVSSLGAWGVGVTGIFQIGSTLFGKVLAHFFLATFVEGWVILVLLGFIAKTLDMAEDDFVVSPLVLVGLIVIGAPLTFPYGIEESMIDLNLSVAGRMGGFLVAEGIILFAYSVIKSRKESISIWIWPLIFLALKAIMQLIASVSPAELWLSDHGVRILYLHVILLGAFTTGMIGLLGTETNIDTKYFYAILISVIIVIGTLFFFTGFCPPFLRVSWIYEVLTVSALFPVVTVFVFWVKLRKAI